MINRLLTGALLVTVMVASIFFLSWRHEVQKHQADVRRVQYELGRLDSETRLVRTQVKQDSAVIDSLTVETVKQRVAASDAWQAVDQLQVRLSQATRPGDTVVVTDTSALARYQLAVAAARDQDQRLIQTQDSTIKRQANVIKAQAVLLSQQGELLRSLQSVGSEPVKARWEYTAGVMKSSSQRDLQGFGRVAKKVLGPIYVEAGLRAPLTRTVQWHDVEVQGSLALHF